MPSDELVNDLAIRLWAKSEYVGDCLIWNGCVAGQREYGVIGWLGGQVYIHRLIYQLHNPDIILDTVRHTCDTPRCWNIDHLINGTTAENVDDKVAKLRHIFGSRNWNTKFTDTDIVDIRSSTKNLYELGKQYDVTPSTIHYIRARKTWKHVL